MADDNSFRSQRSNDPHRRGAEPAREPAGSDPLAELARLIGQNDPMADFGRSSARETRSSGSSAPSFAQRPSAPLRPSPPSVPHYSDEPSGASRDAYPAAEQDYASPLAILAARAEARRAESEPPRSAPRHEPDEPLGTFVEERMHAPDQQAQEEPPFYEDEAPLDPYQEQVYDDAPRARRRGGLVTALALIGCAMLGTAGAYAYRSYAGPSTAKAPPPVIAADTAPTKITAAPPAADSQSSKQISERFAAAANADNLVSRQEEPVALREPTPPPAPPRVVLPSPVPQSAAVPPPVVTVSPPAGVNPPAVANPPTAAATPEAPRRVRTVTIRPDGNDMSGHPVGAGAPMNVPRTPAQPRAAVPAHGGNAPLSLSPGAVGTDPAPRLAAREPVGAISGGYVVQLSSQKSESEAQASFRALQAKHPSELGDRQLVIRRADLGGTKGVVYRANVGPFATSAEAQQFCASYKAAGGHCLVPTR